MGKRGGREKPSPESGRGATGAGDQGQANDAMAENVLEEGGGLASAVLDILDALVLVLDREGRIVRFNRACERLTGYSFEEVRGRLLWDLLLVPEEMAAVKAVFRSLRAGQFPNRHENYWVDRDGGRHMVAWSNSALVDNQGEVQYVIATGLDITERRRAEEERRRLVRDLALERDRLQAILNSVADEVWACDAEGNVRLLNPEVIPGLGFQRPEEGYEPLPLLLSRMEILNPDGTPRPPEDAPLLRSLKGETVRGEEIARHLQTGELRYRQYSSAPVRDRWGRITGAVAVVRDITEMKQAQQEREQLLEEVRQRAATLDATISSMADGVIIYGPAGQIVRMNPASERMHGYSPQERELPLTERLEMRRIETAEGKPLRPEDTPAWRALQGETVRGVLMVIHPQNRRAVWVTASAAPIDTHRGRRLGAVAVFTDVTDLHDLQQQQAQYVLSVSHGLRTPLTVVQGQGQLLLQSLEKAGLDDCLRRSAGAIIASSHRMSVLLRDLVDLTNLESGQPLHLNREPLDPDSFTLDLLDRTAGLLQIPRVRVESPEDLPRISADPDRLERILINLLSNALKYSAPDTEVVVRLRQEDGDVVFSVADRGSGIPPEQLSRMLEPHPGARWERRTRESLGLGLHIARSLVEAHGGRLWAESRVGEGSTFSFTIPVAAT